MIWRCCILILLFSYKSSALCPEPFVNIGSQCYLFIDDWKTWEAAQDECVSMSTENLSVNLAVMDITIADNQALLEAIKTNGKGNVLLGGAYWLGGRDEVGDRSWSWGTPSNGAVISLDAVHWFYTEPNNTGPSCLIADTTSGCYYDRSHLYTHDCTNSLPYICQAQDIWPSNMECIGNHHYFFSSDNGLSEMTWPEARDICRTLQLPYGFHGDLAVLGLEEEYDQQILEIMASKGEKVHLGATDEVEEDVWIWVDGRQLSLDSYLWYWMDPWNGVKMNYLLGWLYTINGNQRMEVGDIGDTYPFHFVCQAFAEEGSAQRSQNC